MRPIIIEGPDNSGKTTLAMNLVGRYSPYGIYLKSPGSRNAEWDDRFSHWTSDVLTSIKPPFIPILDRVPEIGEVVYGFLFRGDSRLEHLAKEFYKWSVFKPIVVICRWQGITKETEHTVTGEEIDTNKLRELDLLYGMMARLLGSSDLSVMEHFPTGMEEIGRTMEIISAASESIEMGSKDGEH